MFGLSFAEEKHEEETISENEALQEFLSEGLPEKSNLSEVKAQIYVNVGKLDREIVRILHWVSEINELRNEIIDSEYSSAIDQELYDIKEKLIYDVGYRLTKVLP